MRKNMMLSEVRIGDGLRDDGVSFMKTPPVEFCAPVSRDPVPGRRLMRGSACERISQIAIISVTLVLTVGAWACSRSLVISSETVPSSQLAPSGHVVGLTYGTPLIPSPTATPQPTPSQ